LPASSAVNIAADRGEKILVIVPTYNERANLESLTADILALGNHYSILVVDDNSPDGTGTLADELAIRHDGRFSVLHRPRKSGIGRAYVDGFRRALTTDASSIATMDADHSHRPSDLHRLITRSSDADLVLGSRYIHGGSTEGWPLHRRLISRLGGLYARIVLGIDVNDPTGGFKVYRRQALEELDLDCITSDGYAFQIETTYRTLQHGFLVVEVPIQFVDRVAGKSKLSRRIVLEAMVVVWKLRLESLGTRFPRRR
jgi:dolichol-phosphate mannosyltransferase